MSDFALLPQNGAEHDGPTDLGQQFELAREALAAAETALAEEQATINAFRMQVRLKLGTVLDEVLELHAQMQAMLTQQWLRTEAQAAGVKFDPADPFGWHDEVPSAGDDVVLEAVADNELPEVEPTMFDEIAEKRLFRELARRFHPDLGAGAVERAYRTSIMATVNEAYANNDRQTLRDLAGEQNPASMLVEAKSLSGTQRRLHKQLHACNRRRRKVLRQLQSMRHESGARLWRRAKVIEASGLNWWEVVAIELAAEAERLKLDLERLQPQTAE